MTTYGAACKVESVNLTDGERLRLVRVREGRTQADVAAAVGKDPSFVCGLEKGRREATLDEWRTIAATLGVTLAELVDLAGDGRAA